LRPTRCCGENCDAAQAALASASSTITSLKGTIFGTASWDKAARIQTIADKTGGEPDPDLELYPEVNPGVNISSVIICQPFQ
jgi:hypothetical protein